jgi:glycosyltransferase involved in cell wall biosynthesis
MELESMASGIQGICIRPFAQIDDLPAYYALAECLVLPSTLEPWGLVVNEAMASGLPVIVSQLCGCFPDLVEGGGNGFSCDPYDVAGLADRFAAMARLEPGARERMGHLSRLIIQRFSPQLWAQSLAQCARTIVGQDGI